MERIQKNKDDISVIFYQLSFLFFIKISSNYILIFDRMCYIIFIKEETT